MINLILFPFLKDKYMWILRFMLIVEAKYFCIGDVIYATFR